jgi:hypothetical protein
MIPAPIELPLALAPEKHVYLRFRGPGGGH